MGQKQYYLAEFSLPSGAESHSKKLTITASIFARATTVRASVESTDFGASAYVFNHTSGEYELVGTNVINLETEARDNLITITLEESDVPTDYISGTGKLHLLMLPTYNPGYQGSGGLSNGYSDLRINNIKLEGVW